MLIWKSCDRKWVLNKNKGIHMATIRGFSLAKISKIKIVFSTFDSRVGSVRFMPYVYI